MKKEANVQTAFESVARDEELFFSSLLSSLSKAEHTVLNKIVRGEGYKAAEEALGYPPTAVLNSLIKKGLIQRIKAGTYETYEMVDSGLECFLKQ